VDALSLDGPRARGLAELAGGGQLPRAADGSGLPRRRPADDEPHGAIEVAAEEGAADFPGVAPHAEPLGAEVVGHAPPDEHLQDPVDLADPVGRGLAQADGEAIGAK